MLPICPTGSTSRESQGIVRVQQRNGCPRRPVLIPLVAFRMVEIPRNNQGDYPLDKRGSQASYSQSVLESLLCGLPGKKREHTHFAMLTAFIDDSGNQPDGEVGFVLACLVASVEKWKSFSGINNKNL